MRALVTGWAVFVASRLHDLLLEDGYEVQTLDNLSEVKVKNRAHLKGNSKFIKVLGDQNPIEVRVQN